MAQAIDQPEASPIELLLAISRAYADFADTRSGYFAVMFSTSIIRVDDAAYIAASDTAFEALHSTIEHCQQAGWRPNADTRKLALAAWSFAHGVSVLRNQGSLARHHDDTSLDAIAAIAATLVED
jgi:hypothetical protein